MTRACLSAVKASDEIFIAISFHECVSNLGILGGNEKLHLT